MNERLKEREKRIEAESIELEARLRRAREKNLPESVILSIKEEIRVNNQEWDALMVGIDCEVNGRYF